jgi:PST family polysaccharide transporter
LPIVVATTIFTRDIIPFVLGSQWTASVDLFRLLAPAALIGAVLSPFGSLYVSSGRADRQLKASLVWTPATILGFVVGLSYGARGVAIGYSIASVLMAVPMCLYAIKGTPVQFGDVLEALKRPGLAALIAGAAGLVFSASAPSNMPSGLRALGGCLLVLCVYALVLLKVMGQWSTYVEWTKYSLPANWFNMRGKPAAAAHSTNL